MSIVFTCSTPGCGLEMSAPDGSTGKKVRCPRCGTLQLVPRDPRDAPAAAAPQAPPVVEAPPQPRTERTLFADGLRAFLYGGSNFRSIFKLVVYFLFVYIAFEVMYGILSFFFLGTTIGVLINMAVSGTVAIVTIGYFLQFYTDVVIGSMEGLDQAPDVPSFSFSDFFMNGLRGLGVLAVYILPVVTLPLLPLGLLALACTADLRAYNLAWAARSASKRPGALLTTWGMILLWGVLMFPAVWVVGTVLGLTAGGILTVAPGIGGILLVLVLYVVGMAFIGAVVSAFTCMQFRCVGLLARHEPDLPDDIPETQSNGEALAYLGGGIAASLVMVFVVIPAVFG
jgi:hypothetical protein